AIAVSEVELDHPVPFFDRNEPMSEVQPIRSMRRTKHTLQVGPVNADKGRAEAGSVSAALSNRKCRDAASFSPSSPNQFAWFCGECCDSIETPEALEFWGSIGGQTHRRTNFSQFRRLFVDVYGQTPLA